MDSSPNSSGDNTVCALYEASMKGCVSTLNTLMEKDPLILNKLSLTTFNETPLHISASFGHLLFTKTLLIHKPNMADELDSLKRSPLHFAASEGHIETVEELLLAYDTACLVAYQDGMIPLHYAVIRGQAYVVRVLIHAHPESWKALVNNGSETVFHICVKYNHLETLQVLLEVVGDDYRNFLNSKDSSGGNTILHLAVTLKQLETIRYLLSIPKIRAETCVENEKGFTALDILEQTPKNFKTFEIQSMLLLYCLDGIKSKNKNQQQSTNVNVVVQDHNEINAEKTDLSSANEVSSWIKWYKSVSDQFKYNGDWLEDTRGTLGVVATVISTMTFQAPLNPPGGVWQEIPEGDTLKLNHISSSIMKNCGSITNTTCIPETSILASIWLQIFSLGLYFSIPFLLLHL
ncbi:Ankyrin repeat-containing protein [Quillaja saponaria]|uniref:Ankyrin repeat-containing protein n=1 Tax=Quillaja saponaria TaxID=32244 RepID=A0AAD7PQA6_QUISA|nr:Ankyrin repeat-containing protein [Quillaja saponaria]